jgi:penicillin-binding protein 1A
MGVWRSIAPGGVSTRRVRAVAVAALLVAAYAAALAWLHRPAVQARLRERIVEALRARLGDDAMLEGNVAVDPLLRISFGPLVLPGGAPRDPPALRAERVKARPRLGALLAGRVEPASVELSDARIAVGPALERLRAHAEGERPIAERGEDGDRRGRLVVRFRRLTVVVTGGARALELGPIDGDLTRERDGAGERISLDLRLPGGGRASLDAERAPGDGWRARASAARLGPGLVAHAGGMASLAGGSVSIEAEGAAAPHLASAEGHVRVGADGIVLAGARVGPAPLGPIRAEAEGTLLWNGRNRRLSLAGGRASLLGAIEADVEGDVALVPGLPFSFALRASGVEFAAAVAALPRALAPPPAAPRPAGTLDARAAVAGPLLAPAEWALSASLDLSRMREAARAAPPVDLRAPFVHRPNVDGPAPEIAVGPANPGFVPIAELPVHVVRAVTTSEDGGFFAHEGFDFGELRNALAEDAEAGHVVRGGSTITQQLAKNLYLTGERTLTRKVREAVIAVALEATIPKQRLLEIYLNIVEWGPGVWGIGPAARHWFGKDARELTPIEAAFLASIIPNPTRYRFMRDRGAMSETFRRRVEDVLFKMTEQGVLEGEDLLRALEEPVVFTPG